MKWFKKKVAEQSKDEDNLSPGQRYNVIRNEENKSYLRNLLAEQRPSYVQERILNVLVHEESTIKKINIVEKVDKYGISILDRREKQIKIVRDATAKKSSNPKSKAKSKVVANNGKIEPVTQTGGTKMEKTSFLQYLFSHWKKISAFGRMTSFIRGNFFKRRHEATDKLVFFWNKDLKNMLRTLRIPVQEVLDEGWKELTVLQYNLVAHLFSIIDYFFKNELLLINQTINDDFFLKSKCFVEKVLTFSGTKNQKDIMIDGMFFKFSKLKKDRSSLRQFIYLVEKMFDPEENLFRSILALNMIYRRKFIFLEELKSYYTAEAVSIDSYNCSAEVKEKMEQYVASLRKEHIQIENDLNLLTHLENSKTGELSEGIFKIIIFVYFGDLASDKSKEENYSMVSQRLLESDMKSFLERFISNFRYKFYPLLGALDDGNSVIEGNKKSYFNDEITKINFLFEKLANRSVAKEGIVVTASLFNDYLGNKGEVALRSKAEEYFFELFIDFGKLFYELSMKIFHFVSDKQVQVKENLGEESILGGDAQQSDTFFAKLEYVQKASLGAAYILKEERLYDLLLRKTHLEERKEEIDSLLLRMS